MNTNVEQNIAKPINRRNLFIRFLFSQLEPYQYVLLKHIEPSVLKVDEGSDLDILIKRENQKSILAALKKFEGIVRIKKSQKSSFNQLYFYFDDGSFLQLDFLYCFIRQNHIYLNTEEAFEKATINEEGIKVSAGFHLFEHVMLFNFLNFAGIKKKYVAHFSKLQTQDQQALLDTFNQKYKTTLQSIDELGEYSSTVRNKILQVTSQLSENKGLNKFKNTYTYIKDQMSERTTKRGITITFSGVDGAGKSTILFKTEALLKEKYRQRVVMLRHRPQLLPILSSYKYGKEEAEKRAAETMPRTGSNKSSIGSFVRFAYYYLDYIVGQFYIFFKYNMRGITVLYDRYYFDFIVDHRRSNINISSWIPKALYTFVFKPDLNFFLYAPPEVILKRKQELDADSIRELTAKYKSLFEGWDKEGKQYIPIKNIVLEETLSFIEGKISAKL